MMESSKKVMIIAGEASGDNYGGRLARALKEEIPHVKVEGVGGERMREEGVDLIEDYERVTVVGFTEVFSRLPSVFELLAKVKRILNSDPPDAIVLIDFPDFNFVVGRYAKRRGIPVVYYIPPQMWAWREGRAKKLKGMADEVVVPFPFEVDFYGEKGIEAKYFGHPIMELAGGFPEEYSKRRDAGEGMGVVGLFPGSRESEIERHLPLLIDSARLLGSRRWVREFVIPVPTNGVYGIVEDVLKRAGNGVPDCPLRIVMRDNFHVIPPVECAVATSGTITLELALLGVPTVVIYKVSRLTYSIGKMLVKTKNVALPNIVLGEEIFPELLQEAATGENIAIHIEDLLYKERARERIEEGSRRLREMLGGVGPSVALASLIRERFL